MTSAINTVTPILRVNARNMYQRKKENKKRMKKGGKKRGMDSRRQEESNWFVEHVAT